MMNATLEVRKAAAEDEALVRQPWMDLPRAQLTVEQRKQLAEYEKRAAEVSHSAVRAARRVLTQATDAQAVVRARRWRMSARSSGARSRRSARGSRWRWPT